MKPPWFDGDGDHCQTSQFSKCEKMFDLGFRSVAIEKLLTWLRGFECLGFRDCEKCPTHIMDAQAVEFGLLNRLKSPIGYPFGPTGVSEVQQMDRLCHCDKLLIS